MNHYRYPEPNVAVAADAVVAAAVLKISVVPLQVSGFRFLREKKR